MKKELLQANMFYLKDRDRRSDVIRPQLPESHYMSYIKLSTVFTFHCTSHSFIEARLIFLVIEKHERSPSIKFYNKNFKMTKPPFTSLQSMKLNFLRIE